MSDYWNYEKIAEKNLAVLQTKLTRDIYSSQIFKMIINGSDKYYPLDKILFLKNYINHKNEHIAADSLECLCKHGFDLNEAVDVIKERIKNRFFSNKVIELAGKMNLPDILLLFMNEEDGYINKVILTLKKTNNESYLTTLMFAKDEDIVKTINKLTT